MKVVVLHTPDALGPPVDPVLGQVDAALQSLGHESTRVVVETDVPKLVQELIAAKPDLVINMAEAFDGKSALESSVTGLLNLLGLRYTGSSPAGLIIAGDKTLTKKVLGFHSIKSPKFATMFRGAVDWAGDIDFPLIVKPPQEDASLGITSKSVVHDVRELLSKMAEMQSEYQSPALVEEFVEGREFYVGVLGNANAKALPVIEMDFSGFPADKPRIASYEAKWGDDGDEKGAEFAGTKSIFPESLDPELEKRLQTIAIDAFHALRLRDYARIDFRVNAAGDIYVIEVNPNCYLEKEAEFASAARKSGLEYDALIGQILELAIGRYSR
jgi:D-alanine-D-alanine ligase